MARKYSNVSKTMALTGGINTVVTSLTVDDASGLPVTFPYAIAVDYEASAVEIMLVTAAAGNTLTVTRGQEDTAAQTHSTGAVVVHAATALDFQNAADHIEATQNVHGVGSGNAVVGTGTTQTLTGKTISGASNTLSAIPGSALTGAITVATIAVANVTGDWPIDTRSTGSIPIDTRTTGNLPIDTRSTGSIPVDTRTTGNLPGSRLASPVTAAMTFNSTIDSGAITSTGNVEGTDFLISGTPDRSVKDELDDLKDPPRVSVTGSGTSLPNNVITTSSFNGTEGNRGGWTVNLGAGTVTPPVAGFYEFTGSIELGLGGGGTVNAVCDVYVYKSGAGTRVARGMATAGFGTWTLPIAFAIDLTTSNTISVAVFHNNGAACTVNLLRLAGSYVGPS